MILELPDDGPRKRYIIEDAPCGKTVTTQVLDDNDTVTSQSFTVMVTKSPPLFSSNTSKE